MRLHRSYLLRLYWDSDPDAENRRVVLEDPVSAKRHCFHNLEELVHFLEGVMCENETQCNKTSELCQSSEV